MLPEANNSWFTGANTAWQPTSLTVVRTGMIGTLSVYRRHIYIYNELFTLAYLNRVGKFGGICQDPRAQQIVWDLKKYSLPLCHSLLLPICIQILISTLVYTYL